MWFEKFQNSTCFKGIIVIEIFTVKAINIHSILDNFYIIIYTFLCMIITSPHTN